jgi:uncharacterized membrane protein YgcG
MKSRLVVSALVASVAALAAAAPASAARISGTVVHQNHRGHSFVVAGRGGSLKAIHARTRPRTGSVVQVQARRLRNGTYAASKVRARGSRRHARIRGRVTWVDHKTGAFTVSSRGASLLVHPKRRAGKVSAANSSTPPVGSDVTADVTIADNGDLEEQDVQENGQANNNGPMDLEGVVLSTDTTANTITVSADDNDESGSSNGIVVHVPDASKFPVGSEVELVVTGPAADGSFTLAQSSLDDNQQEADNSGDDQGGSSSGDHGGGNGDNGGGGN